MKLQMTDRLKAKIEEQAQAAALGDVLSDWPSELNFDQLLEQLDNSDEVPDAIIAWMPHEHLCPASLAELIRDTYQVQYLRLKYAAETALNLQPQKEEA